MSDLYEAVLNAESSGQIERLLAEFIKNYGINSVFNGHTLLSAALLAQKKRLIPFLMKRGSDPRIVNRIKLTPLQTILYHGDPQLDVLKLLFETSLYYIDLSVVFSDFYKHRHFNNCALLCCAYIEAVRSEQLNPVPVMRRLGALLAPRQYALSLAEKERKNLAEEVRRTLAVYGNIRRVFFHPASTASRLPQVIARAAAEFLAPCAADRAVLRKFF